MANTHTTLTSLFTDIADAIREKKGTTGAIVADNFPSEIAGISTESEVSLTTAQVNTYVSDKVKSCSIPSGVSTADVKYIVVTITANPDNSNWYSAVFSGSGGTAIKIDNNSFSSSSVNFTLTVTSDKLTVRNTGTVSLSYLYPCVTFVSVK